MIFQESIRSATLPSLRVLSLIICSSHLFFLLVRLPPFYILRFYAIPLLQDFQRASDRSSGLVNRILPFFFFFLLFSSKYLHFFNFKSPIVCLSLFQVFVVNLDFKNLFGFFFFFKKINFYLSLEWNFFRSGAFIDIHFRSIIYKELRWKGFIQEFCKTFNKKKKVFYLWIKYFIDQLRHRR